MPHPRRVVSPIHWVKPTSAPPWLRHPRRTPRQREGVRYERSFGSAAVGLWPHAHLGQWWEFEDGAGHSWAQTDIWVERDGEASIIIECKLTWSERGMAQLLDLYKPLVEHHCGRPPLCILAAKNLRRGMERGALCTTIAQCERAAKKGLVPILHWMGGELE